MFIGMCIVCFWTGTYLCLCILYNQPMCVYYILYVCMHAHTSHTHTQHIMLRSVLYVCCVIYGRKSTFGSDVVASVFRVVARELWAVAMVVQAVTRVFLVVTRVFWAVVREFWEGAREFRVYTHKHMYIQVYVYSLVCICIA